MFVYKRLNGNRAFKICVEVGFTIQFCSFLRNFLSYVAIYIVNMMHHFISCRLYIKNSHSPHMSEDLWQLFRTEPEVSSPRTSQLQRWWRALPNIPFLLFSSLSASHTGRGGTTRGGTVFVGSCMPSTQKSVQHRQLSGCLLNE